MQAQYCRFNKCWKYTYPGGEGNLMNALTLNLPKALRLTDEEFEQLLLLTETLLERLYRRTDHHAASWGERQAQCRPNHWPYIWNRQTKLGVVLTPLDLVFPRVAISSWCILGKAWSWNAWQVRNESDSHSPDFVIELRSETTTWKKIERIPG